MEIGWESILGHGENIARLRRMLGEEKLSHALLFAGPTGVGKGRVARSLAAALLCERKGGPCGICPSCAAFLQGTHPDYYEIRPEAKGKAKPIIRIEQIREMQGEVARLPILSKRRVVLMEDAEMMNGAAANSLLKTLEEPVGPVTFLLVTSARSSLPETILSRCTPVNFGMIPASWVEKLLMRKGVPEEEAKELALLSDGSVGKAELLRENGGMELRLDAVEFLTGLGVMDMDAVWRRGKDTEALGREKIWEWFLYLRMLLRDLLVLRQAGGDELLYSPDLRGKLLELLPEAGEEELFSFLRLVRDSQKRMGANVNLRLFMEGFIIRCMDIWGKNFCRQ